MHRFTSIALVLILAAAASLPAAAAGSQERRAERMAEQFERLFQPMLGALEARAPTFTDRGNGFSSLSYELDRAGRDQLLARASGSPPFRVLACGHMAAEPLNPATVVTALISDVETLYNLWFVVLNATDLDEQRKTAVRVTGPGEFEFEAIDEETFYAANSITLIWINPETAFAEIGLYIHRVTVRGGGKAFYRFWAEEASTIPE